jgi:ABC-2 type transport system permease protein
MRGRIVLAIARKDALDILRNRATLVGLLFPVILSFVWLFIVNTVGSSRTDILVDNPGRSSVVRVVTAAFPNPKLTQADSPEAVANAFGPAGTRRSTPYAVGLIVPADFDSEPDAGGAR